METVRIDDFHSVRQLVLITIGTERGTWWADQNFGSDLWKIRQSGKLNDLTETAIKQEILRCLTWLKEDGLVTEIEVSTQRIEKNRINYQINISSKQANSMSIAGVFNGI